METSNNNTDIDEEYAYCSDDEKYCPGNGSSAGSSRKGTWEPEGKNILAMYSLLDSGQLPDLEWQCFGRRSPSPKRKEEVIVKVDEDARCQNIKEIAASTEFDFDDYKEQVNSVTPQRRISGPAKVVRNQPSFDKIMSDLFLHKKMKDRVSYPSPSSSQSPKNTTAPLRTPSSQSNVVISTNGVIGATSVVNSITSAAEPTNEANGSKAVSLSSDIAISISAATFEAQELSVSEHPSFTRIAPTRGSYSPVSSLAESGGEMCATNTVQNHLASTDTSLPIVPVPSSPNPSIAALPTATSFGEGTGDSTAVNVNGMSNDAVPLNVVSDERVT